MFDPSLPVLSDSYFRTPGDQKTLAPGQSGWLSDQFGPTSVFLLGGLMMVALNSLPLLLRSIREIE